MKIRITSIWKKISPSVKLERKIDSISQIVNRNKLICPVSESIDEIMQTASQQKVKYKIYY